MQDSNQIDQETLPKHLYQVVRATQADNKRLKLKVIKGLRDSRRLKSQTITEMVEILESKIVRNAFDRIVAVPATISRLISTFQQIKLKESLI